MQINGPEYLSLLKEYLDKVGPNPGSGMAGSWAWRVQKEREFKKFLSEKGIELEE